MPVEMEQKAYDNQSKERKGVSRGKQRQTGAGG